jgi:hypothetical protein
MPVLPSFHGKAMGDKTVAVLSMAVPTRFIQ